MVGDVAEEAHDLGQLGFLEQPRLLDRLSRQRGDDGQDSKVVVIQPPFAFVENLQHADGFAPQRRSGRTIMSRVV